MKQVKSVARTATILAIIAARGELSITELRRLTGIPKSTTHDIVATLAADGLVARSEDGTICRLGIRMLELGLRAQQGLEVRAVATPLLKQLNARCNESVHLTVLDAGEVLYVESFPSSKSLRAYSPVGLRAPLHCTGVGKAILANLDPAAADAVIADRGLARFTARTITSRARLLVELERTRHRGYSIDDCEHEEGVRCVGAPIRDHTGHVVASLSVAAPSQRMPESRLASLGSEVVAVGNRISKLLGGPSIPEAAGPRPEAGAGSRATRRGGLAGRRWKDTTASRNTEDGAPPGPVATASPIPRGSKGARA